MQLALWLWAGVSKLNHHFPAVVCVMISNSPVAMHLHGRTLQTLLPRAVDRLEDYEHVDGELVAGLALGWNFGDGHLHDEGLLRAIQAQCGFEEGELRCVFVESQPLFGSSLAWRIADARTGVRETGELEVKALREMQPWPKG